MPPAARCTVPKNTKTTASGICAAQSSVLVRRRGLALRIARRAAVTRAVGVITAASFPVWVIGSYLVCFIGSSFLPDARATLVAWTCGVGVVGVGVQVMSRLLPVVCGPWPAQHAGGMLDGAGDLAAFGRPGDQVIHRLLSATEALDRMISGDGLADGWSGDAEGCGVCSVRPGWPGGRWLGRPAAVRAARTASAAGT